MTRPRVVARYEIGQLGVVIRAPTTRPLQPLLARWSLLPRGPRGRPPLLYDVLLRPGRWRLSENGRSIHTGRDPASLRARLELAVYAGVTRLTPTTPLHAAAVALPAGVVLLVGASGAGKTSLALALQRRGASYLGEEHAFVTDDLTVRGLPRAQQLDLPPPPGAEAHGGVFVPPQRVAHSGRAAGVVLLETPRTPAAALESTPAVHAAAALTAAIHRPPRPADLRRLTALAAAVPVARLACEGIEESADRILGGQWGG